MSKHKNFKINRNKLDNEIKLSCIAVGDTFEREGSLHMRVSNCHYSDSCNKIWICNINTGSVWQVPEDSNVMTIKDCEINYTVKG